MLKGLPVLVGGDVSDVLAVLRRSDFLNETAGLRVLDLPFTKFWEP